MIIDTFLYNGERKLLDLRMCELQTVVEHFVAVEGILTFTGHPRTIDDSLDDIPNLTHLIVVDFPEASARNPWKREMHQRNAILRALGGYPDDALIMISDVDEIPEAKKIPGHLNRGELVRFKETTYHFNFNNRVLNDSGAEQGWNHTVICRLDDLRKWYPQGVRNATDNVHIIKGGWHFSWFGDTAARLQKLDDYSHQELKQLSPNIEEAIKQKWGYQYEWVEGINHLPACIQDDVDQWIPYFKFGEPIY